MATDRQLPGSKPLEQLADEATKRERQRDSEAAAAAADNQFNQPAPGGPHR